MRSSRSASPATPTSTRSPGSPEPPGEPISRVTWQAFRLPFRSAFANSRQTMAVRDGLVVTVRAGRVSGVGEASFLASDGEPTLREAAAAAAGLAHVVVGRTPGEAWARLAALRPGLGLHRTVHCAFETAIADAAARCAGISLSSWLAAGHPVPSTVAVNGVIQAEATDLAIDAARGLVARGIRCLKLKVPGDPHVAARHMAAVRDAVGDAVELRADANCAWSPTDAAVFLRDGLETGLTLCEEPLRLDTAGHAGELARLRRLGVRIGVDESCRTLEAFEASVAAGACDALVLKPMISGLHESLAMIRAAARHRIPVIVTTTFDGGIGTAMTAHVAALREPPMEACGLATLDFLAEDLVNERLEITDGSLVLPATAGLGVTPDPAALARYAMPIAGVVEA